MLKCLFQCISFYVTQSEKLNLYHYASFVYFVLFFFPSLVSHSSWHIMNKLTDWVAELIEIKKTYVIFYSFIELHMNNRTEENEKKNNRKLHTIQTHTMSDHIIHNSICNFVLSFFYIFFFFCLFVCDC